MYNSNWYNTLIKPPFTPPDYIFRPAWIILYSMMFCSLWCYILSEKENKKQGYIYFTLQIFLNLIWSPVFFIMRNISLALIIIISLIICITLTIIEFYRVSKISAYLLIPYLIWVIFAAYLNLGYKLLN